MFSFTGSVGVDGGLAAGVAGGAGRWGNGGWEQRPVGPATSAVSTLRSAGVFEGALVGDIFGPRGSKASSDWVGGFAWVSGWDANPPILGGEFFFSFACCILNGLHHLASQYW